jgi:hypothetical protein
MPGELLVAHRLPSDFVVGNSFLDLK